MNSTSKLEPQQRQEFYGEISKIDLVPLWESLHSLVTKNPEVKYIAHLWKYSQVRPYLLRSGELIGAREAIRRVLVLENPQMRGAFAITPTLYAGLQLILPNEVAPSHRHMQSALRFIVEGKGGFTAVDGERTMMHEGDLILTPQWHWHDHGHVGSDPMVWLDALDLPLVNNFGAAFAEEYPEEQQAQTHQEGGFEARYAANMLPVRYQSGNSSPIFNYRYERSREALYRLNQHSPVDEYEGFKLRYINPANGKDTMPTIATFLQLLPKGFVGKKARSTDGTVYHVVEGSGKAHIGSKIFEFTKKDIFVVPSWEPVSFETNEDVVLFSFSDRPVQEALGLLRESRA
ncbi:gentisate 1,2-dioxygenase [Alcaligenes parafaecalis]|uniref:Gentisate 1,2-dioxygenase n=1 Tax=Alcaligenes parafaecalis TaxID=171260 RepID=A0ABT3VRB9_9BURK|nr:gentisate 1,2-dioxygenase [Alcaligenes parafaecalis]MCX5464318.1 gentisate 1,2-dioxygenase [Alcaligenes parafaecalis]